MSQSLYEKYGGFATVSRIVMRLYDRILDDDDLGPFFDDIDMPKMIDHQTKFVASLMGGPASFTDAHLTGAHRGLAITDAHFDRLGVLVSDSLGEFGVAPEDADAILVQIEARRPMIVKAPAA
ncbi:group 1 truncated hemoglobin [Rhodobacterales bacterium HKCCE2091]|nr:group 1 truncated hemoglobin [Rhodobacterales bacterium HKCCE2091]